MGATVLQPGEETSVSFVTHMSRGMEGPHLFRISVPVAGAGGAETVVLWWRADFR